jgi:SAM-dependent methyltransferase
MKKRMKWDWERIATEDIDDEASIICIGGERSLNDYINRRHQEGIWKYSSEMKVERYLDAACGTGRFLKEGQSIAHVAVGLDFARNMLKMAKSNVVGGCLIQGDLSSLPLRTEVFDMSTCVLTLKLLTPVENFMRGVSELTRVMKRDGEIFIIEDVRKKRMETKDLILHTARQIVETFDTCGAGLDRFDGLRIAWPLRWYKRCAGLLFRVMVPGGGKRGNSLGKSRKMRVKENYPSIYSAYLAGLELVLFLNRLLDQWFASGFLKSYATEVLFVFKKR